MIDYFGEGDIFVFNDTKGVPSTSVRNQGKTDAKIEVFLLRELNEEMRLWDVLVEPARKDTYRQTNSSSTILARWWQK